MRTSDFPYTQGFKYSFDHLAEVAERLIEVLGLSRYALYVFDGQKLCCKCCTHRSPRPWGDGRGFPLGTQRRGRRSQRPRHIYTVAGHVPGDLFTIDDGRLMFSAFKMAHTRSATHCSLALLGVGS